MSGATRSDTENAANEAASQAEDATRKAMSAFGDMGLGSGGDGDGGGSSIMGMIQKGLPEGLDLNELMEVGQKLQSLVEAQSRGEELDPESTAAVMQTTARIYRDMNEQMGGKLESLIPKEDIEDMQACLDAGDQPGALRAAKRVAENVMGKVGKLSKIKSLVELRISRARKQVTEAVMGNAEDGFKEIAMAYAAEGSIKELTGMDMDELDPDDVVAASGPLFLKLLHGYVAGSGLITPIYIIAMSVVIGLTWPHEKETIIFFIVQMGLELFGYLMGTIVDHKYKVWDRMRLEHEEGGDGAEANAASGGGAPHEGTNLLNAKEHIRAKAAAGQHALVIYDEITGSVWYSIFKILTPVKVGWGFYGLSLFYDGLRCARSEAVEVLFDIWEFYFVFTLLFTLLAIVFWIISAALQLKAVAAAVRGVCIGLDAATGLSYPIFTVVFDKVVMRSKEDTIQRARLADKHRLEGERAKVNARLAMIDIKLMEFADLDDAHRIDILQEAVKSNELAVEQALGTADEDVLKLYGTKGVETKQVP